MRAFPCFAVAAWAATSGCTFDPTIPLTAVISCAADGSCPSPLSCQRTINRCVPSPDETLPELRSATLVIAPGQSNPLPTPTRLGLEGTARITFFTTVPLLGVPVLRTTPPLSCPFTSVSDSQFELACRVQDPNTPDGLVTITAEVVGANLNSNQLDLTAAVNLVVDLTPPPDPDTRTPNRVIYRRVPWGMDATGGAPSFTVTGFTGALSDSVLVRVVSDGAERGRGAVSASGGFSSITLNPVDSPSVRVVGVDQAGNQSAEVLVHDVEWFATLEGKVANGSDENPHAFEWVRARAPILARRDAVEASAVEGLDRVGGRALHLEGGASWQNRTFFWPAQRETAFAYDSARGRLVRFGGFNSSDFGGVAASNELTEWNGTDWFPVGGVGGDGVPPPRMQPAMAYDESAGKVTVFGGRDKTALGDTWLWDGASWRQGHGGPAARYQAALFADPRRERLLLFGGRGADGGVLGDFWEYSQQEWRQLDAGTPSPRAGAATTTDPLTGNTWLFGGESNSGLLRDTWRFDGATWVAVGTGGSVPAARRSATLAYDPGIQRLMLLGGVGADGGTLRDLSTFDGFLWTSNGDAPGQIDPTPSFFADTVRGRMVLAAEGYDGFWQWSGAAWRQLITRVDAPFSAGRVPMTRVRDSVVMLASKPGSPAQSPLQWTADGWLPFPPAPAPPTRTATQDMTFDPQSNRLVLLSQGGPAKPPTTSAYWYAAPATGWSTMVDGGFPPTEDGGVRGYATLASIFVSLPDRGPALAWSAEGLLALWSPGMLIPPTPPGQCATAVSETGFSQLYKLNGTTWEPQGSPLTENLLLSTAAGLPDGGVAFAGSYLPDVSTGAIPRAKAYQWVGGALRPLPDTKTGGVLSMTWDEASDRLLSFGGFNPGLTAPAVLYALAGTEWRSILTADPEGDGDISPRTGAAFTHDADAGTNIAFGGINLSFEGCGLPSVVSFSDTWQLHLASQRPAGLFKVSAAAAQIPDGFVPVQLTLQVNAAGRGQGATSALDGYQVEVWRAGRWRLEETVSSQPGQLQPATVRIQDPQQLEQLLRGQSKVVFQLSPRGVNGRSVASIDVDYVQLKLDYRLP